MEMQSTPSSAIERRPPRPTLLDDFSPELRREAVRITEGRIPLEVSGSVGLGGLRSIAEDGVDCISIGGLTKHVQAIDLSLKLGPPPA